MDQIRKIIRESLNEVRGGEPGFVTVFHGTHEDRVPDIEADGLKAGSVGYSSSQWYMVATDMDSAVFHTTPKDDRDAYVIEFKVPVDNSKWEGFPYFWPPYDRKPGSKWFALKQPIPSEFIQKVHKISNEDYIKSKNNRLDEEVIEETHVAQKDLEKFANDILKFMGQRCIDEYVSQMKYDINDTKIYRFPIVHTGTMKGEGYGEIGDFVEQTSIKIFPVTWIDKEGTKGRLSYGSAEKNFGKEYFEIKLKYQGNNVEDINEILRKYPDVTAGDVYFKLFYIFFSTLLHELQHAYDAWRSKGKAFNSQQTPEYLKQQDIANKLELKNREDLTPEEVDAISNSYKAYLNLTHEINARFAQAMHKVRMVGLDDNLDDVMKPWDGVFKDFQIYFDGWRVLSDKMKRKLTRRLAKAYQEESENLKTYEEVYGEKAIFEVRSIVRSVLKESVFEEAAMRVESLPDTTALFIERINQGYTLVLYDPKSKSTYAVITFIWRQQTGPDFYVSGVAAEKGFGPLIYELAMMLAEQDGRGLMPSRDGDVRGDAWNVWTKFYDRSDVDKKELDLLDDNFRCDIITGDECEFDGDEDKVEWWSEMGDANKKTLKIFNTAYSMKPGSDLYVLADRADQWLKSGFDKQIAIDAGDNFWHNQYI